MNYTFDINLAQKYGVNAAIVIANFQFWISKNKANNRHFYDGRYWTYNSVKAFEDIFPFWTGRQIRKILDDLVNLGILIKGNYNKITYDRTLWYAFKDEDLFLYPVGDIHLTKKSNQFPQNVTAIPDNKPDNKTGSSSKTSLFDEPTHTTTPIDNLCERLLNGWNYFCDNVKRNTHKCRILSPKNVKKMKEMLKQAEMFKLNDNSEKDLIEYIFNDIIIPVYENDDFLNGEKISKGYDKSFPFTINYILDINKFTEMYNKKSCLQNR